MTLCGNTYEFRSRTAIDQRFFFGVIKFTVLDDVWALMQQLITAGFEVMSLHAEDMRTPREDVDTYPARVHGRRHDPHMCKGEWSTNGPDSTRRQEIHRKLSGQPVWCEPTLTTTTLPRPFRLQRERIRQE